MADERVFMMGCGAGFSGDRVDAPVSVVEAIAASGRPGAIMFETLAERTLALGHVARRADPSRATSRCWPTWSARCCRSCLQRGIPIVGNFGARQSARRRRLLHRLAAEHGLDAPRIAVIEGDDIEDSISLETCSVVGGRRGPGRAARCRADRGQRLSRRASRSRMRCWPGRRSWSPAGSPTRRWRWVRWSRISAGPGTIGTGSPAGTLVGHLLECGAQVTGGYFADPGFKDVPGGRRRSAFRSPKSPPTAPSPITKAGGTGGRVNRAHRHGADPLRDARPGRVSDAGCDARRHRHHA